MTITGDEDLPSAADGDTERCMYCRAILDPIEGSKLPKWFVSDDSNVCDDCYEKRREENERERAALADRLLWMLTSLEREVIMLIYGWNERRHCYSLDEVADRIGITRQRVTEIHGQAIKQTRGLAKE
jgi:DNA-directed RNA polymerase sigma subunit (sigma70/sigma32)